MKKSRRLCILFLSVVFVSALCAACAKAADNAPDTLEPGYGQGGAADSMSDTEGSSNGEGIAEVESTVTESGQPESQKQGGTAENEAPAQKDSTESESAKQETSVQEDKSDIGAMHSEQEQQSSGSDSTPGTGQHTIFTAWYAERQRNDTDRRARCGISASWCEHTWHRMVSTVCE